MSSVRVESLGARADPSLDRYIIIERDAHLIKRSHNLEFPYSFSLEEAETFFANWL